jgi:RNA polymerase sigma-70 factor, ECF subfamily
MPAPRSPHVPRDVPAAPDAVGEKLGEFYTRHGRMVLGVCRMMVRDPDEAEDAAQQTFLSAYAAMLQGTSPRDPAAWLGTIARNECRSRVRARTRAPLALTDDAPPTPDSHSIASGREDVETVLRALSQLSERQRDAVILRSVYGLSYRDVAKALGTSVAGVETLLFRGRRRLSDIARPQLAAAHALLVVPLTLKADLARLIPGFEMGTASAGGRAIGIAGGVAGLGIASTVGGGGGSGITGLLGAPIAARIVGVVTAATIGIAAAPTLNGPGAADSLKAASSESLVAMTAPARSTAPVARETPRALGQGAAEPVRGGTAAVDRAPSSADVVPGLVVPQDLTTQPATFPPTPEPPADPSDPARIPTEPTGDDSQPHDADDDEGERAKEKKRRNRSGRHRGESRGDDRDDDGESRGSESEESRTDDAGDDDPTSGDSRSGDPGSEDSKSGDSEPDRPKSDEPRRDEPAPDEPKNDAPSVTAPTTDEPSTPPQEVQPAEDPLPLPAPPPPPAEEPAPDPVPTDPAPTVDPATSSVPEPSLVTADIIASSDAAAI